MRRLSQFSDLEGLGKVGQARGTIGSLATRTERAEVLTSGGMDATSLYRGYLSSAEN